MRDRTMDPRVFVWMFLWVGYYSQQSQSNSVLLCLRVRMCVNGIYASETANKSLNLEDASFKNDFACLTYKSCQNTSPFLDENRLPPIADFVSEEELLHQTLTDPGKKKKSRNA